MFVSSRKLPELHGPKRLTVRQESGDKATPNIKCASHLSASVFSLSRRIKLQWQSKSYNASTRGVKSKSSVVSWQLRAKLRGEAKARWLTPLEAKPQIRAKRTSTVAMLEP